MRIASKSRTSIMAPLRFARRQAHTDAFDGGLAVVSEFTGHRALYTTRPLPSAKQMRSAAASVGGALTRCCGSSGWVRSG